MELSKEAKRILKVLADEAEKNPSSRLNGVDIHKLGAAVGAYLNNPIYSVAELKNRGLISRIGNRVILTDEGYSYVRPLRHKNLVWLNPSNPLVYIILTIIAGVIVGLILLLVRL